MPWTGETDQCSVSSRSATTCTSTSVAILNRFCTTERRSTPCNRPSRATNDDAPDIPLVRDLHQRSGNIRARDANRLGSEVFGEAQVFFQGAFFRRDGAVRGLDEHCQKLRPVPIRHPPTPADQILSLLLSADAHHDPLSSRPCSIDALLLHVFLELDFAHVGHFAQRHFAQRNQIALAEESVQRPCGAVGRIDIAVTHALAECMWRHVDQLNVVAAVDDAIGDALADRDAGDVLDEIRQAFQVLDVHGADDGDARVEQVFDVLPALFVF